MSEKQSVQVIEQQASVNELQQALSQAQSRLRSLGDGCGAVEKARILLDIAEPLIGLNQHEEAWRNAREAFSVFVDYEAWQDAVETAEILYQSEQPGSVKALGHGIWIGITYPVKAQTTVTLLNYVIDETPDDSDGGAVAAMAAHYIADIRTQDDEHKNLTFLTTQMVARVARRHRNIEDQETLDIWIDMLELKDIPQLLKRLSMIVDVMAGDNWWFNRDELRAKLPVN